MNSVEGSNAVTLITVKGYIGKDEIEKDQKILDQIVPSQTPSPTLAITINSTSGDLVQVLNLAKQIYSLREQNNLHVIVYIEENAIGPAAILPFLADELYCSHFISWGDIPLSNENVISANLLRNQVTSFISFKNPHQEVLKILAAGMSDKSLQIVDDNGWKIAAGTTTATANRPMISSPGETLVVNHNQLKDLGIISETLTAKQFEQKLQLTEEQHKQIQESVMPLTSLAITAPNLHAKLTKYIKFNPEGFNKIGHIVIEDRTSGITESTWLYVKKALEYYKQNKENKPIFVILELNTPGGEVYAAQKISDALKQLDTQDNIPVVAFINNWAISAGAMLAYSCRFIAITKDAAMGAAEPIILAAQTGEMKEASEKINSALRTDFANRASFFDRNPYIAEAMVDKDIILVMRHGKIMKLDNENQIKTTGTDPDKIISPKGKLLTLNAEQLMQYGVADIMLMPTKLPPITEEEKVTGKWPASKELLFQESFLSKIPQATIDSYRMDWKTKFFVFLANPVVSSILMLGLMMGFYLEMNHPGFGVPGTIALVCLFLIILSSLSLEIAGWLEAILLLTGIALILIDLFVLPTFGLLGVVGLVMAIAGLFAMLLPGLGSVQYDVDTQTLNAAGEAFFERLAWLAGTLVLGIILILIMARYVTPSLASWSRLVLTGHEQEASLGYFAGDDPKKLPQPGTKGEAFSTLRTAGKVLISGKIYDALTEGSFIDKGTPIVVTRLDGGVIIVDVDMEK